MPDSTERHAEKLKQWDLVNSRLKDKEENFWKVFSTWFTFNLAVGSAYGFLYVQRENDVLTRSLVVFFGFVLSSYWIFYAFVAKSAIKALEDQIGSLTGMEFGDIAYEPCKIKGSTYNIAIAAGGSVYFMWLILAMLQAIYFKGRDEVDAVAIISVLVFSVVIVSYILAWDLDFRRKKTADSPKMSFAELIKRGWVFVKNYPGKAAMRVLASIPLPFLIPTMISLLVMWMYLSCLHNAAAHLPQSATQETGSISATPGISKNILSDASGEEKTLLRLRELVESDISSVEAKLSIIDKRLKEIHDTQAALKK